MHVVRERKAAKFWLDPVRLAYNYGFSSSEFTRIEALVREHETALIEAWNEYFRRSR